MLLLRRAPLPRLAQAARPRCCHGGAAPAPAPARRNALKLLQGLLKHERGGGERGGGDRRRWRPRRETGALSPDAWALVEKLAEKGQLKAPHATTVLAAASTPAEVGRIARLADDAGLEGDLPVVRTLFRAWCRCGHHAYAVAVLQDAVERGVLLQEEAPIVATKPLATAAQQGRNPWQLFRLLQSAGLADRFHYNIMLPLCTPAGSAETTGAVSTTPETTYGEETPTVAVLLGELQESGARPSTDTFNTRLTFAADTGGESEGWTDSARAAAALVAEMRHAGVSPDAATYSLLHTCYLGAAPSPSAAAAADVLAEARAVVPREFSAKEVSSTATLALRELRGSDAPDLAWEYFSALQVGGIADGHHLAEVMHLCEDTESLTALVAQAALAGRRMNRRGDSSSGTLELAMHQHLVRLGEVQRAAIVLTDFAKSNSSTCEPYMISTGITSALRELCGRRLRSSSGISEAWSYFGEIQQRGLADVFHYNLMLQQCNTPEGVERLLAEMDGGGVPRNEATVRALHITWAQLGEARRAVSTLAAGIEGGAWASIDRRHRVVSNCLAVLLGRKVDAASRSEAVFAYLSEVEDLGLLRLSPSELRLALANVDGNSAGAGSGSGSGTASDSEPALLTDDPYAMLLRYRGEDESSGRSEASAAVSAADAQEAEVALLSGLLEHVAGRPSHVLLDGRGCALLLRRAAAAGAPGVAARALREVDTDRVSRSKLATSTLRGLVTAAEAGVGRHRQLQQREAEGVGVHADDQEMEADTAGAMVTELLNALISDGIADTYQYNIGLRHAQDRATVAGWVESMAKSGEGNRQTLHLLQRNWSDIAVTKEWQRNAAAAD
jgi:hypothetical protein